MTKKPTAGKLAEFTTRPNTHPAPEAPAPLAKSGRVPFSTYIDRDRSEAVRRLALSVSVERGVRVSVADLVDEAIADLLAKYGG